MMREVPNHPKAKLYPSEIVTFGLMFALKGIGPRALAPLARPKLSSMVSQPAAPHALVSLAPGGYSHPAHVGNAFLAQPIVFGVADTYGIEV